MIGNIFLLLPSPILQTRNTRSRYWGTPKSFELSTCHSQEYPYRPTSMSSLRKSNPPPMLSKFLTFSQRSHLGLSSCRSPASNRITSKNNPLRSPSCRPFCFPATLMSWHGYYHGNPKHQRSALGNSIEVAVRIS